MPGKVKNLTDKKDLCSCIPIPDPNKSFRKPLCVQTSYPLWWNGKRKIRILL